MKNTSGISCTRSYRTLRDGSFEGTLSQALRPGYDRCCPSGDCRTSAKNELFSCFWTIKTACPPFKNACTGILERRLFQNGQSPTAPSGTQAPCGPGPGDKSPGYCHRSLRDAFWPAPQATILSLSQLWLKKRFY